MNTTRRIENCGAGRLALIRFRFFFSKNPHIRTRRTPAQCSAASQIVAEPPQTLPRTPRAPGEGRAAGRWPTSTINATPARAESPPSTSFTAEIPPRSTLLTTLASTRSPVPIAHAPSAARTRKGEREERVLAVAATAATSSFSSSGATALPGRECLLHLPQRRCLLRPPHLQCLLHQPHRRYRRYLQTV